MLILTNGKYNLNIIGVRNLLNGDKQDNTFNDAIICIYKDDNNIWIKNIWECNNRGRYNRII